MSKLIIYTALVLGLGFFKNSTELIEEPSNVVITENSVVESAANTELEDVDESVEYKAFLQVLEKVGPKEGEVVEKKSIPVVTEESVIISDEVLEDNSVNSDVKETKANPVKEIKKLPSVAVVDHSPFGQLLKKHVNTRGDVNYAGLKNDGSKLEAYIKTLQANPVTSGMSKNERLSYWINVYNAFTLKLIIDNYPLKSITDLEGGKPWDKKFILLGSTTYSLNDIENKIIRKRFTEPRIHFAINCAAASCPPLLNDAYYPNKLMEQLDERTRSFIANTNYNKFNSGSAEISKIFEWYGEDFGTVKSFLTPYLSVDIKNANVTFREYDWALNKQ